jgi:hypothetical protein
MEKKVTDIAHNFRVKMCWTLKEEILNIVKLCTQIAKSEKGEKGLF